MCCVFDSRACQILGVPINQSQANLSWKSITAQLALPYDLKCENKPQQIFSFHKEIEGALNLEPKKLWLKDNGQNNWKRRYLAFSDCSYNNHYCYYHCLSPRISIV